MCGLTGIAQTRGSFGAADPDVLLQRMTRVISHRGPDETVLRQYGAVALGFARLSLVDPVGGGQPLETPDGSLVLIANGEIYNRGELAASLPPGTQMQTGSDCEVLLYLYREFGLSFLDKVRGIFAVVLLDRKANKLVFARDRFGIKPLFYHQNDDRILFASEMKALFVDPATPRALDWGRALGDQLINGRVALDAGEVHAWFDDIELVPASTILTFDLSTGRRDEHEYWRLPGYEPDTGAETDELISAYSEALSDSVRESCIADVEIGLFLSGGIDSAAVAALASPRPRTFTALNASTLLNGDAEHGHRIAKSLGLVNHQVILDAARVPTVQEWKGHLWLVEAPIAGPESYYKYEMYRYVREHAPEIKGMLLGVGSDEFNGGYTTSFAVGGDWTDFIAHIERMALRHDLGGHPGLNSWWELPGVPLIRAEAACHLAGRAWSDAYALYHRWKYRHVQQYNCWHEDRSAAGNGIEARVPFLDHRLVEVAAAVPAALRPKLIWDKGILRAALRGVLPAEFLDRPKIPFFYGTGVRYTYRTFARMLAQDGASLVEEALSAPGAKEYLDPEGVRAALAELIVDPDAGNLQFLLRVVNLGLLELMSSTLPPPLAERQQVAVAAPITIDDWDTQRDDLDARLLCREELSLAEKLALPEGALLLRDGEVETVWYLAVNGQIEYVIDDAECPGWRAFLQALDGDRDIAAALAAADTTYKAIAEVLEASVDEGVLRIVPRIQQAEIPQGARP